MDVNSEADRHGFDIGSGVDQALGAYFTRGVQHWAGDLNTVCGNQANCLGFELLDSNLKCNTL